MAQAQLLVVGTDTGIELLSNPGRSKRWLHVASELAGSAVAALASTADTPPQLIAETAAGCLRAPAMGGLWQPIAAQQLERPAMAIELEGLPPTLLRATPQGIERSADHGGSWELVAPQQDLTVLHPASFHQDLIFAAAADGSVIQSHDRGRSWEPLFTAPAPVRALLSLRIL